MRKSSKSKKKNSAPKGRAVFDEISGLVTEKINKSSLDIDTMTTAGILRLINNEDSTVAGAVKKELRYISKAVKLVVDVLTNEGRLFYVGAGTSGRLGVFDASECPPTFGSDPKEIQGIIAGGNRSLVRSREGVEDDIQSARRETWPLPRIPA